MKLFLSSLAISPQQAPALIALVGKNKPEEVKIALIENAADVYAESKKGWMYDNRHMIQASQFQVDLIDLQNYKDDQKQLLQRLAKSDVIWLGGGNIYYLRWILKETHADKLIIDLVKKGKVYGGGSAGAIIAGPTIDHFQAADEPGKPPEVILDGLGLTDTVVLPHWDSKDYGKIMKTIKQELHKAGLKTIELNDGQAVVIDNEKQTIIES